MAERKPKTRAVRVAPGVVIDRRYRIVSHLGEGGMGTVLVAEHVDLGRRVALKVLQERVGDDPSMRKRFEREARTLAAMSHPNIVALNDYGIWEGTPYLVMELLEGRTLRDLLDAQPLLPIERALAITQQVLRALSYAHGQNVIHRDLKPGNVFLQALPDQIDHVKLLDFGFAKFVNEPSAGFVSTDGIVVGTPAYMAPEQAGGVVDHRADVYAMGVLLFEMLTAKRPFEGTPLEMIRGRMANDAPRLRDVRPDLDVPELEKTIAHALARRPEDRLQTAAALSAALAPLGARLVPAPPRRGSGKRGSSAPAPAPAAHPKTVELASGDLQQDAPAREARTTTGAAASANATKARPGETGLVPKRRKGPLRAPKLPPSTPRPRPVSRVWVVLAMLSVVGLAFVAWRASPLGAGVEIDPSAWLASARSIAGDEPSEPERAVVAPSRVESETVDVPVDPPIGDPAPEEPVVVEPASDEVSPPIEVAPAPAEEPIVDPATVAEATATPTPTVEATTLVDPWSREIPPDLLALRTRIERPTPPETSDLQLAGSYARHHPEDARALTLLAHGYVRIGWMSEAFDRYAQAHGADPLVRGDPNMREDLVTLSTSPAVGERARDLVVTVYGRDALSTVDARLASADLAPGAGARLRALREAIVALP